MALEKYHFESSTGVKLDVPFMQDAMSFGKFKKLNKQYSSDYDALIEAAMKEALSAEDVKKVDELSVRDATKFFLGWAEQGDATPGES